jgi:hypothetical protein
MHTKIDERWHSFGVTMDFLESKAEWLRAPRMLHGSSVRFFELASSLISCSRFDYPLSSLAFFQAVIGLERALKLHYRTEEDYLSALLKRALKESLVQDSLFSSFPPLSERFLSQVSVRASAHSETLLALVPELRNQFFHGTYLLAPEYLYLTIQMREISDVLVTKRANQSLEPTSGLRPAAAHL